MNKQTDLIVTRRADAYCLRYPPQPDGAQLAWSATPYDPRPAPLCAAEGTARWVTSPDPSARVYFALQAQGRTAWAADMLVEIDTIDNFRDLGGYMTDDGRTVKWGCFFRSGVVAGMGETEGTMFARMGIRHILDYRAANEAQRAPDQYPGGARRLAVPAIPAQGSASTLVDMDMATRMRAVRTPQEAEEAYDMFLSLYDILPFGNAAYRQLFAVLDEPEGAPLIQHCSAGKDRTGVGCALLLLALGVDEATVRGDYLLSAVLRTDATRRFTEQMRQADIGPLGEALVARMLTVTPQMLNRALTAIQHRYPSLDAFFEAEYGIDAARRAAWRARYTVPA